MSDKPDLRGVVRKHPRQGAKKFCPEAGLLSAEGLETSATGSLLHMLLKPVGMVMVVGTLAFSVRDLLLGAPSLGWVMLLTPLVVAICTVALFSLKDPGMRVLRALELAIFAAMAIHLLVFGHSALLLETVGGSAVQVVSVWNLTVAGLVLVMATYAIFIPSHWLRTAAVIAPLGLAPVVLLLEIAANHPQVIELGGAAFEPARLSDIGLVLTIAAVVCVLGTALIARFRSMTFQAREAGLYDLRERIGAGGMGEVWRAEHHVLARPAAIKIIRPELAGTGANQEAASVATRRFEREAQATAGLRSPHTIEVYDFGVTRDGVFYYVMEYLDGFDLETLVERHGPLPVSRAVYLLRQACASLADAHAHGLIHRDIKPANIFACRMGQEHDFVKVLDFGLVKEQRAGDQTQLTQDGLTTGTPAYMAPEMALQDNPIGPPTDIYALGCVAYWLVTGKLVFERDTPVATVVDHVKTEPVPPSQRTELAIPTELDAVILKALAKAPQDRYASMREFASALASIPTTTGWDGAAAEEWWRLHRPEGSPLAWAS